MSRIWSRKTETKVVSNQFTEEQMKFVLRRSDTNKDGRLSKQELKKAYAELGVEFPNLRAVSALWRADDNGDGCISRKELGDLVKYTSTLSYTTNK